MNRRNMLLTITLGVGILIGAWIQHTDTPAPPIAFGPATANAQSIAPLGDGQTFVSATGGTAYVWQLAGDRLVLLGECARTESEESAQAYYVWRPGIERRE